jgi:hypothetical protein
MILWTKKGICEHFLFLQISTFGLTSIPAVTLQAYDMLPNLYKSPFTEKVAFEDMCSKGFIQKDRAFPGHFLGEFSALASIGKLLPVSSLVDVVFYHSVNMQCEVERDINNWQTMLCTP